MNPATYQPIPVAVAKQIAEDFAKSQVVILAFDPVHQVTQTTTYGKEPFDMENAAAVGKICAQAIGCDLSKRQDFEDYHKDYDAAKFKALIESVRTIHQHLCRFTDTGDRTWLDAARTLALDAQS